MTHVLQCPHCSVGQFSAVSNANTSMIISSVFAGCQIPYPKREFLNEDEPEEKTEKVILFSYSCCVERIVDVRRVSTAGHECVSPLQEHPSTSVYKNFCRA